MQRISLKGTAIAAFCILVASGTVVLSIELVAWIALQAVDVRELSRGQAWALYYLASIGGVTLAFAPMVLLGMLLPEPKRFRRKGYRLRARSRRVLQPAPADDEHWRWDELLEAGREMIEAPTTYARNRLARAIEGIEA